MSTPNKADVVAGLQAQVQSELESLESLAAMARDEATSPETKSEGKYDTRATEASYLARGQAWRITELRQLLAWLHSDTAVADLAEPLVQVSALVRIEGARSEIVFVAPIGGGKTTVGDETIRLISPASPLGEAMAELELGDAFEVDSPRGVLEFEITGLS
jgi:transcription elongation GreA/GreB family factor